MAEIRSLLLKSHLIGRHPPSSGPQRRSLTAGMVLQSERDREIYQSPGMYTRSTIPLDLTHGQRWGRNQRGHEATYKRCG